MSNQLDSIISDLQTYVVAPLNAFGMGGFVFDTAGEAIAHLTAEITDHYSEDNKALQDHIAIHPKRITLKGYVGELVYRQASDNSQSIFDKIPQKLTQISAFLPQLSAGATQLQAALAAGNSDNPLPLKLSDTANIYATVKNMLSATGNQANQQNAYNYFKALMQQGILMGIQTPWEFMPNMAIESIVAIQSENSIFISDFAVTYKQIRIAETQLLSFGLSSIPGQAPVFSGDASLQAAAPVPLGNQPGAALPDSSLIGAQSQLVTASDCIGVSGIKNLFSYSQ